MHRIVLGAIVGVALSLTAANAQSRDVPAGKTTMIEFVGSYDTRRCMNGARPRLKVSAANGTVTTKWTSRRVTKAAVGPRHRKCAGRMMKGMAVYYTPDRGYRGPDQVNISFSYDQGNGRRKNASGAVSLNVR